MTVSLNNTLSADDLLSQAEALRKQQETLLAQRTQQATQQAQAAQQQYAQAAAQPPAQIDPADQFVQTLIGNLASTIGGEPSYRDKAQENLKLSKVSLIQQRKANLEALQQAAETSAKAAQEAGDHEQEIKIRSQIESRNKALDQLNREEDRKAAAEARRRKTPAEIEAEAAAAARGRAAGTPPKQPAPRRATAAERAILAFYQRGKDAADELEKRDENGLSLEDKIAKTNLVQQARLRFGPNAIQSPDQQVYRQAQRAFTEARLRKESGAAISPREYENDAKIYFAQPGDSKAVIERKRKGRQIVLEGLRNSAGPAYKEYYEGEPANAETPGPSDDEAYQEYLRITGQQ